MIIVAVVFIDFLVFYLLFMYQRATLLIARSKADSDFGTDIKLIQSTYTPAWIGAIGWLNWVTFIFAIYLLWQVAWWYAVIYFALRFFGVGLLPTFDQINANKILARYHARK